MFLRIHLIDGDNWSSLVNIDEIRSVVDHKTHRTIFFKSCANSVSVKETMNELEAVLKTQIGLITLNKG